MKAVLVIDEMPKSCYACPLTYIDYGDDTYYGANTTRCVIDKDTIPRHGKWDECPLKPLPQKMKTPITEAIPVEWMEVWLAEHEAWDFRTTFIDMINDWRNGETEC